MKRKDFILNSVGLIGLSALPKISNAISHEEEDIYLLQEFVRGFQYYNGIELLSNMKEGDSLTLVREAQNIYDKNAVAVYYHEQKIGFLPREENHTISKLLDANLIPIKAKITKINTSTETWEHIFMAVYTSKTKDTEDTPKHLTTLKIPTYKTNSRLKALEYRWTPTNDNELFEDIFPFEIDSDEICDIHHIVNTYIHSPKWIKGVRRDVNKETWEESMRFIRTVPKNEIATWDNADLRCKIRSHLKHRDRSRNENIEDIKNRLEEFNTYLGSNGYVNKSIEHISESPSKVENVTETLSKGVNKITNVLVEIIS